MPGYSARMLSHFNAPHNAGAIPHADIIGHGSLDGRAPYTEIYLMLSGERIDHATFTTFGCGAAIACGSALTELISGKTARACREITTTTLLAALDGLPADKQFCADIAVAALQDAIRQWQEGSEISEGA